MKCLNHNCLAKEIEKDDNFCYECGHFTAKGYSFLKDEDNRKMIEHGDVVRQKNKLIILWSILAIFFISFGLMYMIRKDDLFKPVFFLKKQALNYIYGYQTSLIKTNNKYHRRNVSTYEDAVKYIVDDFNKQDIFCFDEPGVKIVAASIEETYDIPSVSFCDMSLLEAEKIEKVIQRIYQLFPNIKGGLTNIVISNDTSLGDYIARFQPIYQFVNINENNATYNKVNKTQILLNSYYFLNENMLKKPIEDVVGKNWYVEDASWESTIAHEYGHYISFYTLLKKYNMNNVTFVTLQNQAQIDIIFDEFNNGLYSLDIVGKALSKYNAKYHTNLTLEDYANSISKYASVRDFQEKIIADETIAEAIHDYYLHGDNMKATSKEIVDEILLRLSL